MAARSLLAAAFLALAVPAVMCQYVLNITANSNNQVNVSTGIVDVTIDTTRRAAQPLAVYSVDKVPLPYDDRFGVKPPTPAPPASIEKPSKGSSVPQAPAGSAEAPPSGAAAGGARAAG